MKQSTKSPLCQLAKKGISFVDKLVNLGVALLLLLMVSYGTYSIYDSRQALNAAQESQYETYKPETKDTTSFQELVNVNPDVLGWLNVYGTHIDYPLLQGESNETYLNTDPLGKYQLSGSIFLDYRNNKNFTDFNTIIYGHHMAKSAMFGDLDKFNKETFFDNHKYGNLYFDGSNHGVEFFAFINADAFDSTIYQAPATDNQDYLNHLKEQAKYYRDISVSSKDRIVVLSTCTSDYTNGRHVLVGRITDQEIPIPEELKSEVRRSNSNFSTKVADLIGTLTYTSTRRIILFVVGFILLFIWYLLLVVKRKKQEERADRD